MLNIHTDLLDDLDAQEYYLASHIARHLNANGRCWPSIRRLTELTGWAKNTVLKVRRRLIRKKVYCTESRQDRTGRHLSTNYQLATGQISIYADLGSASPGGVHEMNPQQTLGVHNMNREGARNEPEVLSREVLSSPTYLPSEREQKFDLESVADLDRQYAVAEAAPEKEKSSAQKEKPAADRVPGGQPVGVLEEAMPAAAARIGWQPAEARIRHLGPTYDEVIQSDPDRQTYEDLTDSVMAAIATDRGRRRLDCAARAAGVDLAGINVYAAVYACAQHHAGRSGLDPGALIRKLPGYLKTEARKAVEDRTRNQQSRDKIKRTTHGKFKSSRYATSPADVVSDAAALEGAELAYREYCERTGTAGF
jgi:hypothetical protein